MLLKEDGFKLGQAMTFGQPKVTNGDGARKYSTLPLLRFVNDKDPVSLLPPFELFAVLDEGPFQHFGPEVVLGDGGAFFRQMFSGLPGSSFIRILFFRSRTFLIIESKRGSLVASQ
jgi:hypothetical protein